MSKAPKRPRCAGCGDVLLRDFSTAQFGLFKKYTEDRINGQPIVIESAAQRDRLMKEHHLTYDSVKFWQPPERKTASDAVTLEEVKREIQQNPAGAGAEIERRPLDGVEANLIHQRP